MGANFWYIPIHEVVTIMDPRICATPPMFYAFTGCDTFSAFCGRGKQTAWNIWKAHPEVTEVFEELQLMQTEICDMILKTIEQLVVLFYDHTSDIVTVNDSRKYLFTLTSRSLENLPLLKKH